MSKRLQVILADAEMEDLKRAAALQKIPVGELVRRAVKQDLARVAQKPVEEKLRLLQKALTYNFETNDIDQMNEEIERGYSNGLP